MSCISSYSYIKPQLSPTTVWNVSVVYHPIPTSNHNVGGNHHELSLVVYHPIPTSNHNLIPAQASANKLYIILFLHQTTTVIVMPVPMTGCLSSYSYIKPQLADSDIKITLRCISSYSYIKPQPSSSTMTVEAVVYHPIPTSNHNLG